MAEVEVCYLEAGGGGVVVVVRRRRSWRRRCFHLRPYSIKRSAREGGSGGMVRAPGRFFLSWSEFPRGRSGEN